MDSSRKRLELVQSEAAVRKRAKKVISQTRLPDRREPEHESHRQVKQRDLINKLNYINFQDRTFLITFKHYVYDRSVRVAAKPKPCQNETLVCSWEDTDQLDTLRQHYNFDCLLIPDGQQLLQVHPELIRLDMEGAEFKLPESCDEVSARKVVRHLCQGIRIQIIQYGNLFNGNLLDFNAISFRVELEIEKYSASQLINPDALVSVIMSSGEDTIFTGECRLLRHGRRKKNHRYVLEPLRQQIQRFQHKEFRSTRQELNPSPNIYFHHPLTNKLVSLKVLDLSGSGFSVEEDEHSAVLMTGMVISGLTLRFGGNFSIECKAQVVYRKVFDDGHRGNWVKCGLAILDMNQADNVKLLSMLHQADNRYAYVCNDVDPDELWDFFFETGFIYPEKYAYIEANKTRIKETYRRLYSSNNNIARHFICQEKGRILGHMAMVRFYQNTWMIHHHAARKSALNRAGLIVLKQIGSFINDSYRLNSIHLDYVIFYYRPDNKFPSRVFGGATRFIDNKKRSSYDPFAYLHLPVKTDASENLPSDWKLTGVGQEDLMDLESFYEHVSGGLMLKALNIEPNSSPEVELVEEYSRLGFRREKRLFALKHNGLLKAVILANISDIGLNLSNLTNSISFIVLDPEGLSKILFYRAVNEIALQLGLSELTTLVYPTSFVERIHLPCEKIYNMWVMNLKHIDHYFRYIERLMRYV